MGKEASPQNAASRRQSQGGTVASGVARAKPAEQRGNQGQEPPAQRHAQEDARGRLHPGWQPDQEKVAGEQADPHQDQQDHQRGQIPLHGERRGGRTRRPGFGDGYGIPRGLDRLEGNA